MTGRHRRPSDEQVIRRLLTPGAQPDPDVDAVVDALAGKRAAPALPAAWGCSVPSHDFLGWCCNCPGVSSAAELSAWRIIASGAAAPDLTWARRVTECGT